MHSLYPDQSTKQMEICTSSYRTKVIPMSFEHVRKKLCFSYLRHVTCCDHFRHNTLVLRLLCDPYTCLRNKNNTINLTTVQIMLTQTEVIDQQTVHMNSYSICFVIKRHQSKMMFQRFVTDLNFCLFYVLESRVTFNFLTFVMKHIMSVQHPGILVLDAIQ